jgi:hypothetical protein
MSRLIKVLPKCTQGFHPIDYYWICVFWLESHKTTCKLREGSSSTLKAYEQCCLFTVIAYHRNEYLKHRAQFRAVSVGLRLGGENQFQSSKLLDQSFDSVALLIRYNTFYMSGHKFDNIT